MRGIIYRLVELLLVVQQLKVVATIVLAGSYAVLLELFSVAAGLSLTLQL